MRQAARRSEDPLQTAREPAGRTDLRIAIGPIQYFWPRAEVERFYENLAGRAPMVVYLGETVCSKRRELGRDDWLAIGRELAAAGHEVVVSTLSLIEAASELGACRRWVENGEFTVEANDMSAIHYLAERKLPFVAGPGVNLYNHLAVDYLSRLGMFRMVLPVELGRIQLTSLVEHLRAAGSSVPEIEYHAWGRLPLAWSARCFTARAVGRGKDQCRFECLKHPDGQRVATREGEEFLNLNGVQVQSAAIQDLAPRAGELAASGVRLLRLYPQPDRFDDVIDRFEAALAGKPVPLSGGSIEGYWLNQPGISAAGPSQ
ncbi:MAG: U32 family peptidase [Wenzhouxiangellaceae bacterium]|nr:U32 family peptidase [Wenzhouxiangellaceae bacterium]